MGIGKKKKVMGVLDIYGFEILEVRVFPPTTATLLPRVGVWRLQGRGLKEGRAEREEGSWAELLSLTWVPSFRTIALSSL